MTEHMVSPQYYQALAIINKVIDNDYWTRKRVYYKCRHTQKHLDLVFYHLLNDNEYFNILNMIL
jgi:hypothetical protein